MRSLVLATLLSVVGLIGGLLVLELGVRLFVHQGSDAVPWNDRPKFYYAAEGVSSLQDFSHSAKKPPHTYRVGVVGDSFTFAPFMQFTDAFPKKLEQLLNLNKVPLHAEVINYGVPAYSTSHEVAVVKTALEEQADLVLLQITLNDPELKPYRPVEIRRDLQDQFGPIQPTGTKAWLMSHSRLAALVFTRLHNSETHRKYREYFNDLFENPRSWKVFAQSLAEIAERCKKRNVPLVAIVFPLFGLPLEAPDYPFWGIHKKIADYLDTLGVPSLDLSQIYMGIPLDRLQVIPGGDRHPNEIAHRMAAEAIYQWLEDNKKIPAELVIRDRYKTRLGVANQERIPAPAAP